MSFFYSSSISRDATIIRLLEMAITPKSGIRKQDATRVISNVAYNIHGRDLAFDFVKQNWDRIKK